MKPVFDFLTFDHIDGMGFKDEVYRRHKRVELRLWKLYPKRDPNIRVLCYNCNSSRRNFKACPHEAL